MSCDKKKREWNPNQIVVGRTFEGEPIVLVLPQSLAEGAARVVSEQAIVDSCEMTAKIQEMKLAKGMLSQSEYDEWLPRYKFRHGIASRRVEVLKAWVDSVIAASENDAVAVEQTNRIALLEARVQELKGVLAKERDVIDGLREMTRRARENQEQGAEHGI